MEMPGSYRRGWQSCGALLDHSTRRALRRKWAWRSTAAAAARRMHSLLAGTSSPPFRLLMPRCVKAGRRTCCRGCDCCAVGCRMGPRAGRPLAACPWRLRGR
eukprot:5020212-Pyramimonas_sp.AAC.1